MHCTLVALPLLLPAMHAYCVVPAITLSDSLILIFDLVDAPFSWFHIIQCNLDELLFGAVPDVYGNARFNVGVVVLQPNDTTFESMCTCIADAHFPPVEAEQAFLNLYFGAEVVPLPSVYNNVNLMIRERSSLALGGHARRDSHRTLYVPQVVS
jgi:hypothetical protein